MYATFITAEDIVADSLFFRRSPSFVLDGVNLFNAITGEIRTLAWWRCSTCFRAVGECRCKEENTDGR